MKINTRVYAIILFGKKILVCNEIINNYHATKFPGGGVEKGENPEERPDDFDETSFHDGLIAQELKSAMEEHGVSCSAWSEAQSDGRQRIKYAVLVAPLIKAVQELTERVKELEDK